MRLGTLKLVQPHPQNTHSNKSDLVRCELKKKSMHIRYDFKHVYEN